LRPNFLESRLRRPNHAFNRTRRYAASTWRSAVAARRLNLDWLGLNGESLVTAPQDHIGPREDRFGSDPFGYSALAWHKWGMAQTLAGYSVDLEKGPSSDDLKSPVLWLTHAHAMSKAARAVLQGAPNFESMPEDVRGVCHCQYHASL
jgi:hypothetical protein